ncbi:MAG: tetratricopeptide repeat protein [Alphaproteobacteria bacterium]|nr:tetratricopeptide repeat protein [Alphaproteobacteria bacterium]
MSLAPDIATALMEADRLWRAGRHDDAEKACRAILTAHPNTAPALHLLAHLMRLKGVAAEAENLAREALALAPNDAAICNTLGNLLYDRGAVAEAEAAYSKATALQPAYAEAHYNRGLMLRELGRPVEAMAAQQRAAALRPYPQALVQIGTLLASEGRHEQSLARLDEALRVQPDYFDALYYKGVSLTALQQYHEAETVFRAALAQKPKSPEALHGLGAVLNYLNRENEALAAFEQVLAITPTHAPAHHDYNALAHTMGRADLAFKSFSYARQRAGDVPALLLAEAEQRLRLDEIGAAEALLRRGRALAPQDTAIMNALGRALTGQGRFDEAAAIFDTAATQEPSNAAHRREQAVALLHGRKAAAAATLLEKVVQEAPNDQMALALLTLAWREVGDPRHAALTAMEDYVRIYDLPPPPGFADSQSFNRQLAEVLSRLHTRKVEPHDQTLRGGTQTMGKLFGCGIKEVEALREKIGEAIADYIARMPDAPEHPLFGRKTDNFAYFGSWSCRLTSSGFHTNHVHPQGWLSSAYYVALPDAVAGADQQGWIKFGESNLRLGEQDKPLGALKPVIGRLVLFPSYMWHGTVPFRSDAARLTVAFDVVPV